MIGVQIHAHRDHPDEPADGAGEFGRVAGVHRHHEPARAGRVDTRRRLGRALCEGDDGGDTGGDGRLVASASGGELGGGLRRRDRDGQRALTGRAGRSRGGVGGRVRQQGKRGKRAVPQEAVPDGDRLAVGGDVVSGPAVVHAVVEMATDAGQLVIAGIEFVVVEPADLADRQEHRVRVHDGVVGAEHHQEATAVHLDEPGLGHRGDQHVRPAER